MVQVVGRRGDAELIDCLASSITTRSTAFLRRATRDRPTSPRISSKKHSPGFSQRVPEPVTRRNRWRAWLVSRRRRTWRSVEAAVTRTAGRWLAGQAPCGRFSVYRHPFARDDWSSAREWSSDLGDALSRTCRRRPASVPALCRPGHERPARSWLAIGRSEAATRTLHEPRRGQHMRREIEPVGGQPG